MCEELSFQQRGLGVLVSVQCAQPHNNSCRLTYKLERHTRRQEGGGSGAALWRMQPENGKETLPPRTPPGGYSLHFSKARSVETRLHDPMRDFISAAGRGLRPSAVSSRAGAAAYPALTDLSLIHI